MAARREARPFEPRRKLCRKKWKNLAGKKPDWRPRLSVEAPQEAHLQEAHLKQEAQSFAATCSKDCPASWPPSEPAGFSKFRHLLGVFSASGKGYFER